MQPALPSTSRDCSIWATTESTELSGTTGQQHPELKTCWICAECTGDPWAKWSFTTVLVSKGWRGLQDHHKPLYRAKPIQCGFWIQLSALNLIFQRSEMPNMTWTVLYSPMIAVDVSDVTDQFWHSEGQSVQRKEEGKVELCYLE